MNKSTITSLALIICAITATAMPAWRGALKKVQPDGTVLTYYLQGDEWGHQMVTTDGYALCEDADGALRYMHKQSDLRISTEGSPIAHDIQLRGTAEQQYVSSLVKARDMEPYNQNLGIRRAGQKASDYQIGTFPTKGDAHGLVILASFSDLDITYGQEYHSRLMNEQGFCEDGNNGCARDYFIDQSGGLFEPTFDVVGPVKLPRTMRYYGKNGDYTGYDENSQYMIVDACQLAHDELGVDFSQYDYDDDGKVDMVFVIFAGYGENAGGGANTVWPKKWSLNQAGTPMELDGKAIDVFACSSELFGNTGSQSSSIAQFCHEFGHVLGLADHYSTQDASVYHLGAYDLMDYGAYNNDSRTPPSYNAFERMTVGWMQPDELTQVADGVTLDDIQYSNKAYRIGTRNNSDEFYLLENRQRTGWDSYIPGEGLMITHVDFDMAQWNSNSVNYDDRHMRFYMECADNDRAYDVVAGYQTESTDLYPQPGNDSFTDTSSPAASPYTGETLDRWVTNIRNEGGTITFDYRNNYLKAPVNLVATDIRDNQFSASWESGDYRTESYNVALTRMRPESEMTSVMSEDFAAMTSGSNNNPAGNDISGQLDQYLSMKGWTGGQVFEAGGTMCIGNVKQTGHVTSPSINFSKHERSFAVLVKVNSQQGQQPVLSVSANGMTGKTRITSTPRMYLFQFDGCGLTSTTIQIESQKERAYVDSLIILRGTETAAALYPTAKAVAVSGTQTSAVDDEVEDILIPAEQQVTEGIADTQLTIDGLEKDVTYSLSVQAIGDGMTSDYTEGVEVLTNQELGIGNPVQEGLGTEAIYTLGGVRVKQAGSPGVYIIKTDRTAGKVVVR